MCASVHLRHLWNFFFLLLLQVNTFTWLGLAVVALPLPVQTQGEAQLVRVVGQGLARGVRAVVGAAVLALVGRAGVGHLHLMAPLRQWLVGLAVHLLHGSQGLSLVSQHGRGTEQSRVWR